MSGRLRTYRVGFGRGGKATTSTAELDSAPRAFVVLAASVGQAHALTERGVWAESLDQQGLIAARDRETGLVMLWCGCKGRDWELGGWPAHGKSVSYLRALYEDHETGKCG